jgi:hypothetical protein
MTTDEAKARAAGILDAIWAQGGRVSEMAGRLGYALENEPPEVTEAVGAITREQNAELLRRYGPDATVPKDQP